MTTNNVIDFEQYKAKKNKFKNLGQSIQSSMLLYIYILMNS